MENNSIGFFENVRNRHPDGRRTQDRIEQLSGVGQATISRLETYGKLPALSSTRRAIAAAYGIDYQELIVQAAKIRGVPVIDMSASVGE